MSESVGRDAWIAAAVGVVIELVMVFLVLSVLTRSRESDIYSDMRSRIGGIGAKGFVLMMFALFTLQLFVVASSAFTLTSSHLFYELNVHKFMIPLVLFGALFCLLPARAIFRSSEIFWLVILIAVVLSIIPALPQASMREITPILSGGGALRRVFMTTFRNLIFFESAAFLLVFSGDIKVEKNFRKKFMTVAVASGVVFVIFVVVFTAIFGALAPYKSVAVLNLSNYSNFLVQGGQLDWILVCVLLLALLIRFGATFYCAFACMRYLFNIKHLARIIGLGIAVALWVVFVWVMRTQSRLDEFVRTVALATSILFVAVPVLAFLLSPRSTRKSSKASVNKEEVPNDD